MKTDKSQIFFWLLLSFIVGICWRSFFTIALETYFLGLVVALVALFVFYKNSKVLVVASCGLFVLLGAWRTQLGLGRMSEAEMKKLDGKQLVRNLLVANDPLHKDNYQQFQVFLASEKEKILVRAPKELDLFYGDELELACTLSLVRNQEGKGDSFDYRGYLAKEGIYYLCQSPKIKIVSHGGGNFFYTWVLRVRNYLQTIIVRAMPQPEAGLANGILFGGNGLLAKDTMQAFSRTGLTHIVAVSGFNVTVIVEYLVLVGIWVGLWRRSALNFALAGIFIFVLMVGFPASAMRAGVMGSVVLWAAKNGRLADSSNALLLAGAGMLLLNPLLLRWDIGFQLSFLATLGILLTGAWWQNTCLEKYDKFGWMQAVLLTFSAQLLALPVIIYNFQNASPIAFIANALVLPVVPLGMLLVFLTAVVGSVLPFVTVLFAWLAFILLHYIIQVVGVLAGVSWASVDMAWNGAAWIFWYYAGITLIVWLVKKYKHEW